MIWKDRIHPVPYAPEVMECTTEAQGKVFHFFARGLHNRWASPFITGRMGLYDQKYFVDGEEVTREDFGWAQEQELQLEQEARVNAALKLWENAGWTWRKAFDDDKGCELYVFVRGGKHCFFTEQEMIDICDFARRWN